MREQKMLTDFDFLCRFSSYCNKQLFRTKVFSKKKKKKNLYPTRHLTQSSRARQLAVLLLYSFPAECIEWNCN